MATKADLLREQQILREKGFYSGELDGIWGPATIKAKKEFERSSEFIPGIPSKGLPMKKVSPFPKGIYLGSDGLLFMGDADLPKMDLPDPPKEDQVIVKKQEESFKVKASPLGEASTNKTQPVTEKKESPEVSSTVKDTNKDANKEANKGSSKEIIADGSNKVTVRKEQPKPSST